MIVKCEQCQTKFKIPDDKVTDKGVKVRCTKCGNTFRVMRDGTHAPPGVPGGTMPGVAAAPPHAKAPAEDPFAKFGAPTPQPPEHDTRPGHFALGVEATKVPNIGSASALPPVPASSAAFDFATLAPPARPAPAPSAPSAPTEPAMPAVGFDFGSLGGPSQAASSAPFDFGALSGPTGAAAPPMAFDFAALPPSAAPVAPAPAPLASPAYPTSRTKKAAAPPPAAAPPGADDLLGEIPPLDFGPPPPGAGAAAAVKPKSSAPASDDDLFGASLEVEGAPAPKAGGGQSRDELFEMPAAPKAEPPPAAAAAPAPGAAAPVAVARIQLTRSQPELEVAPPRRRSALGVVVNLVIAGVLVAVLGVVALTYANDGKLDASTFSAERLKALFSPQSDYVAGDISNGLYDTRAGRPIFFVRGEVTNRGEGAARLRVRAEILDGSQLVRSSEVVAGAQPTPEELYGVAARDDLDKLLAKLSQKAEAVKPGATVPFTVTFYEYPRDLKAFRVRVSVVADAKETAARP